MLWHYSDESEINLNRYCKCLEKYTVALFAYQFGAQAKFGTGVLLQVADACFIITASHVAICGVSDGPARGFDGLPLTVATGDQNPAGVPLAWNIIHQIPDPTDIALIELENKQADAIRRDKRFLSLGHFDIRPELDYDDAYVILGYPNDDTITDPVARGSWSAIHGYFTQPYPWDRGTLLDKFDKDVHFAFNHLPGPNRNYGGPHRGFPAPTGISGCGIWKVNSNGEPPDRWDPEKARLIAIEHAAYKDCQVIKGTKIPYLVALLRKHRPDLLKSIDLSFPAI